jgi:hypothetical protein
MSDAAVKNIASTYNVRNTLPWQLPPDPGAQESVPRYLVLTLAMASCPLPDANAGPQGPASRTHNRS